MITLGVIGVVAALTMPALISNHKKKVYVTQLKKSVNTLSNGFRQMLADENVDSLEYTALLEPSQSGVTLNPSVLSKYFNIVHQEDNFASGSLVYKTLANGLNSGAHIGAYGFCTRITTADGAQLCIDSGVYVDSDSIGVLIDVNGHNRLPNTVGLDVFFAKFNFNGMLAVHGGQLHASADDSLTNECFGYSNYAKGVACLNSVIMHNWEITYY